jgi:hypothetical protein
VASSLPIRSRSKSICTLPVPAFITAVAAAKPCSRRSAIVRATVCILAVVACSIAAARTVSCGSAISFRSACRVPGIAFTAA